MSSLEGGKVQTGDKAVIREICEIATKGVRLPSFLHDPYNSPFSPDAKYLYSICEKVRRTIKAMESLMTIPYVNINRLMWDPESRLSASVLLIPQLVFFAWASLKMIGTFLDCGPFSVIILRPRFKYCLTIYTQLFLPSDAKAIVLILDFNPQEKEHG